MTKVSVSLERVGRATPDVRTLVGELDAELGALYPPEQQHGLKIDAIFEPHVRFFIARRDGAAVGCGGVALFAAFAELKRMYVRPAARGSGVADALIACLEDEAAAAQLHLVRLETGSKLLAAMALYARHGYRPCAAFPPYSDMPPHAIAGSTFLEKRLGKRPSENLHK